MWDVELNQTFAIDVIGETIIEANYYVWIYLIKFSILVKRLCAPSFCNSDLIILYLVIEEFFDTYCQLFSRGKYETEISFPEALCCDETVWSTC